MKTSVYVPDELWQQVQATQPDASASQLLQDCLRSKLERKVPAYAILSDHERELQDKVATKMQQHVVDVYQTGYGAALEGVSKLTYELLWLLASVDFDLERFQQRVQGSTYFDLDGNQFYFDAWWDEDAAGSYADASYLLWGAKIPMVAKRGIDDAFRFAWAAVSGEGAADFAPPVAPTGDEPVAPAPEESSDAAPQ